MHFSTETGQEREFALGDIPGVLWTPGDHNGPLILLGHGGGQHKKAPGVVARAQRYLTAGFAIAAIDAPGYGDRPPSPEQKKLTADFRERLGAGANPWHAVADYNVAMVRWTVPEWRATIDALATLGYGPFGYFGLSMGSAIGIPLAAAEPRISAATFGLVGLETLAEAAAAITIPVEFVLQWDDQLVPREQSLKLFDTIGSSVDKEIPVQKTLHANPGGHGEVPAFELDSSVRFFSRHLKPTAAG
jgi:pimeloyl-ACP methyl ester carboxylesterase